MALPQGTIIIPNYRVTGTLGEGGSGVVYAAEQIEPPMPMPVAIKVLHLASPDAVARFQAEAAIMMKLHHPSITRVFATGEASGHPYIVMELIEGVTLDVHVANRELALFEKLELFVEVCEAVQYAHDEGVIHRDLKPGNIMVRAGGGVAILDFGVARAGASARTLQGAFLGTMMYMSPEQAAGRNAQIDARADIYSLGVILFEIVRGTTPFDLGDLNFIEAVRHITTQPPRLLGSHDRELDAIVAQALSKRPGDRQRSAAELVRQIRELSL